MDTFWGADAVVFARCLAGCLGGCLLGWLVGCLVGPLLFPVLILKTPVGSCDLFLSRRCRWHPKRTPRCLVRWVRARAPKQHSLLRGFGARVRADPTPKGNCNFPEKAPSKTDRKTAISQKKLQAKPTRNPFIVGPDATPKHLQLTECFTSQTAKGIHLRDFLLGGRGEAPTGHLQRVGFSEAGHGGGVGEKEQSKREFWGVQQVAR